jgi:hypothetical protein
MLGLVHIGVLDLGLSSANAGLAQFNAGTVLVAFFTVAVFVMVLTSLVRKSGFCKSRGVPFELLQYGCAKKYNGSWVDKAQYLDHSSKCTQPEYNSMGC